MIDASLDPLGAVQTAIEARLKSAFGWNDDKRALRQIESIEFPFDEGTDKIDQIKPPGAYFVPLVARTTDQETTFEQQWAVYGVAGRPTAVARATGGIGAYGMGAFAIAYRIAAALDEWDPGVETADRLRVLGIENLSGLTLTKNDLSVLAVTVSGRITPRFEQDGGNLADFLHYHSDWDLHPPAEPREGPLPLALDATNDVDLPGSQPAPGEAP